MFHAFFKVLPYICININLNFRKWNLYCRKKLKPFSCKKTTSKTYQVEEQQVNKKNEQRAKDT